ncbi:MAG: phosphoribosylformylglycinamidine synthase subunit PurS [Chloroflexi bacterium]|nr:phosphoribosylformylglycinamidine synthase subunit PurS [Chloroflexota bacterium]
MYLAKIYVTLKPTVNDPQGVTVKGGLQSLGFKSVQSVRVGKFLEVQIEAGSKEAAAAQAQDMCKKLLANPVVELFRYEIEEVKR